MPYTKRITEYGLEGDAYETNGGEEISSSMGVWIGQQRFATLGSTEGKMYLYTRFLLLATLESCPSFLLGGGSIRQSRQR